MFVFNKLPVFRVAAVALALTVATYLILSAQAQAGPHAPPATTTPAHAPVVAPPGTTDPTVEKRAAALEAQIQDYYAKHSYLFTSKSMVMPSEPRDLVELKAKLAALRGHSEADEVPGQPFAAPQYLFSSKSATILPNQN